MPKLTKISVKQMIEMYEQDNKVWLLAKYGVSWFIVSYIFYMSNDCYACAIECDKDGEYVTGGDRELPIKNLDQIYLLEE